MNFKNIVLNWCLFVGSISVCLGGEITFKLRANGVADTSAIYSSNNGDLTLSINNGILTGTYEYYDKWSKKYHEYLDVNIFYIYGTPIDRTHYVIFSGWPGDEKLINGKIAFLDNFNKIKITLEDQPPGYSAIDFTTSTDDNIFSRKNEINIREVRLVEPAKANLYEFKDGIYTKRKAYLVKGDIVLPTRYNGDYVEIFHHSPSTNKTNLYWLKFSDLTNKDPRQWLKH